jgi:hypothetical protein
VLEVIIDVGVIIPVDGLDATTEKGENRIFLLFGYMIGH